MVKNLSLAAFVILFAIGLTYGLNNYFKSQRGEFFVLEKGQPVPDFTFETTNGVSHKLSDFKDKKIIIHFWASWCAPCVVEFPELITLANKQKDVVILGFSSDRTHQSIDRFFQTRNLDIPDNFLIIHDQKQKITEGKFNVFQLPESFILNSDLTLENHIIGAYQNWPDLQL